MACVIYCQQITARNVLSVDEQLSRARETARLNGLTIRREFVSTLDRPQSKEEAGCWAAEQRCQLIVAPTTFEGSTVIMDLRSVESHFLNPSEGLEVQWKDGVVQRCRLSEPSDPLLERVRQLPGVRSLDLSYTTVTDDDIAMLVDLAGLTELDISGCRELTHAALDHIARMPCLTALCTGPAEGISIDDVVRFAASKRLEDLTLAGVRNLSDRDLQNVAGLVELRSLAISNLVLSGDHGVTESGIASLTELRNLRRLNLHAYAGFFSDESLEHISGMQQLRHLRLSGCEDMTGLGFGFICRLARLTSLVLADTEYGIALTAEELQPLQSLTELQEFGIWDVVNLAGGHVKEISKCTALQRLVIGACGECRPSEEQWERQLGLLSSLGQLESLTLRYLGPIKGRELSNSLADIVGLRELVVVGWDQVGDQDLWALRKLSGLRRLRLNLDDSINLSAEGRKNLQQAMPECTVESGLEEALSAYSEYCKAHYDKPHELSWVALTHKDALARAEAAKYLGLIGEFGTERSETRINEAVTTLIGQLEDEEGCVRNTAAKALGKFGPEAKNAVPVLLIAMNDEDTFATATAALTSIDPDGQEISALIDAGKAVHVLSLWPDAWFLCKTRPEPKRAVPALIRALTDKNRNVRSTAAKALGDIGPEAHEASNALWQAARDDESGPLELLWPAIEALRRIDPGAEEIVAALAQGGKEERTGFRWSDYDIAIRIVQCDQGVPALRQALKHEDDSIRIIAAWTLCRHWLDVEEPSPVLAGAVHESIPVLTESLQVADEDIFIAATGVLWAMWERAKETAPDVLENLRKTISFVTESLKDGNVGVRCQAARVLSAIGPDAKQAVPALVEAVEHEGGHVRVAAAEALWSVAGQSKEAVPALIEEIENDDENVRRRAINALGGIGPEAKDALVTLLRVGKDDETAFEAAARALGRMDPNAEEAVAALTIASKEEQWDVRWSDAWGLFSIGWKANQVEPTLRESLRHENLSVRISGVWALWEVLHQARESAPALPEVIKESAPTLIEALGDKDRHLRDLAVRALDEVAKVENVVPALTEALWDANLDVRCTAAQALGRTGPSNPEVMPALMKAQNRAYRAGDTVFREAAREAIGKIRRRR